ncbi:MAG: flagellar motor protein MotB, partial [Candidatus Phaeomarinobacter sp.]
MSELALVPPTDVADVAEAPVDADMTAPLQTRIQVPARGYVLDFAAARFGDAPRWMVVFADLVALLIAFFVLILSMSAFEPDAIAQLNGRPAGAAGAVSDGVAAQGTGTAFHAGVETDVGAGAQYLAGVLMRQVNAAAGTQEGTLLTRPGGAVLIVPSRLIVGASQGSDIYATLERVSAAAPGRVTALAGSVLGDPQSLMDAISTLKLTPTGVETGFAGWLAADDVAI